ncbi:MAG: YitT family protein [Coprobacillus sp.]|nr:YitT family protein [Coprobacillus sp.]
MKKSEKIKRKINNYLFDHLYLRRTLSHSWCLLLSLVAAFIFAFGFICFATPYDTETSITIVTGGVSGFSQVICLIIELCGAGINRYLWQSILYLLVNVPILIFSFICIGKKFTVYSLINVLVTSVLISVLPLTGMDVAVQEAMDGMVLARALFMGACVGLAAAIAYAGDFSCGGIDVISYWFGLKKSTSIGKYSASINGVIVVLYAILLIVQTPAEYGSALTSIFFSAVEIITMMLIVDAINRRNKKAQIQLITSNEYLVDVLTAYFPHGATICEGKGAHTGASRQIVYMVVSSSEIKRVAAVAQRVDPHVFISATPLQQVYGNFFIRPVD